jgi:hypothetical protein
MVVLYATPEYRACSSKGQTGASASGVLATASQPEAVSLDQDLAFAIVSAALHISGWQSCVKRAQESVHWHCRRNRSATRKALPFPEVEAHRTQALSST